MRSIPSRRASMNYVLRFIRSRYPCFWVLIAFLIARQAAAGPSLSLEVPIPPVPLNTAGGQTLIYELHLTNMDSEARLLGELDVLDADNQRALLHLNEAALRGRMALLNNTVPSRPVVPPGSAAIVYLEIDLPRNEHPRRLEHRIELVASDGTLGGRAVAVTALGSRAPVVLGPPLEGGPWVAVHSPEWPRGHRRVFYVFARGPRIPGRYAIDWVAVDAQGRTSHGSEDRPADALGYGARVLAGIDGRVAATRDGMAEAESIRNNPRHPPAEGAGNYVVLSVGDGRYIFYEHLRPGSILVKPGEPVSRGQVIGALGFSGDTTGPHLHLHVADSVDTLDAEGLPFVISSYEELGRYQDIAQLGHAPWQVDQPGVRRHSQEWPTYNAVVRFK